MNGLKYGQQLNEDIIQNIPREILTSPFFKGFVMKAKSLYDIDKDNATKVGLEKKAVIQPGLQKRRTLMM